MFFKGGVYQGLEYKNKLRNLFGEGYIALYEEFILNSPIMLVAKGLVAVHGGPIKSAPSLSYVQDLKTGEETNKAIMEAEWGRWKDIDAFGTKSLFYYDEVDVKNFLDKIAMSGAFFIVGHSPKRNGGWHWELMPKHHIIFAGYDKAGYVVFRNGEMNFIKV